MTLRYLLSNLTNHHFSTLYVVTKAILIIVQAGLDKSVLFQDLHHGKLVNIDAILLWKPDDARLQKLRLSHYILTFSFLLAGLTASLFAYAFEMLCFRCPDFSCLSVQYQVLSDKLTHYVQWMVYSCKHYVQWMVYSCKQMK